MTRPESARLMGASDPPIREPLIKEWLDKTVAGPYFQDASHLTERKMTLKGWWSRTTTKPMDGDFHSYMSRVADAHVKDGGTHPHVVIPADLTIALMGWVEMRVMTALNTVAPGLDGNYVFGKLPDPPAAAEVGRRSPLAATPEHFSG
jgi:hypothetical protein